MDMMRRDDMAKMVLGTSFLIIATLSVFMLMSVLAGFCLNWLVPSIEFSSATTVGAIAVFFVGRSAVYLVSTAVSFDAARLKNSDEEDEDDEDEDEDEDETILSDEQVEEVADKIIDSIMSRGDFSPRRRAAMRRAGK
jgi:hypothetical protein